jgi:hypothetical protein
MSSLRAPHGPTLAAPPMPQLDLHHVAVRRALEADGWTVTHDVHLLVVDVEKVRIERWRK